ncbi:MAG: ribonuclease III [Actinomycetia bacterium]|nr:ribonuclease III [Actinomycetes bacterium]
MSAVCDNSGQIGQTEQLTTMITENENRIEAAEAILGYSFVNRALLLQAITHPSAAEDNMIDGSYERLEFLGDSYLGSMVAEMLFKRFPQLDEGGMTRMKTALVSGETLSRKAEELGLADLIIFGSSEMGTGQRGLRSALENVFEALIAALVLDGGFAVARQWVLQVLAPEVSLEASVLPENPKSGLQELLQEKHITPTYKLIQVEGPPHNRSFTCQVMAGGKILASGDGRSKKDAETTAAAAALKTIRNSGFGKQRGEPAPDALE